MGSSAKFPVASSSPSNTRITNPTGERSFPRCRLRCIVQKIRWLNVVQKPPPLATSRETAPAPDVNSGNILGLREAGCKRIFFIGRIENCEAWENFLKQMVHRKQSSRAHRILSPRVQKDGGRRNPLGISIRTST